MNRKPSQFIKRNFIGYVYLVVGTFIPTTAFAYVDPGSGSVIVTTVLGLIAAVGYTFRKYFYQIKRTFSKKKDRENEEQDES